MEERRSHAAAVRRSSWTLGACCAYACACAAIALQPVHAHALAQAQTQAQAQAQAQAQVQRGISSEQNAATGRQARKTEQANRAAAVEDETSAAAQAARTAQSETAQFEADQRSRSGTATATGAAAPSYGPQLVPRTGPADAVRKDPAEVHDETDSLTRPAPAQDNGQPQAARPTSNPKLRRPAWQPVATPMAPRPLRRADAAASTTGTPAPLPVPVPVPAKPPRTVAPTSSVISSCQGNVCTDVSGKTYKGIGSGNAGVNSSGRLCTRTGVTVQCF